MSLPGIPTDNLYKLMSMSGVAIAISSAYLYVSKVYEYKDALIAHKNELAYLAPITQIGFGVGLLLSCVGFLLWYWKVQKPLDAELKARAIEQQAKAKSAINAIKKN